MHDFDPRSFDAPRDSGRDSEPVDLRLRAATLAEVRDAFMSQVDLPRGLERVRVHECDREYMRRGSESRTLTTVGAFRGVPAGDLLDGQSRPLDPRPSSDEDTQHRH
jgi:hypothetical protein